MIKNNILLLVISIITFSCGNNRKIVVADIDRIVLDYDSSLPNNYGKPFKGHVAVIMNTGELYDLDNDKNLSNTENIEINNRNEAITVFGFPTKFNENKIPFEITMSGKNGVSKTSSDTIRLNFEKALTLDFPANSGNSGANGNNGNTSNTLRDGTDGELGMNGTDGQNGQNFTIHIWKDSTGMYYFHVLNSTTNQTAYFQQKTMEAIQFNASGGNGGNGGNGGTGGNGRNAETVNGKLKNAGYAGHGGRGGNAGRGGNGGNVIVIIHPSATDFENLFIVNNQGGSAGSLGDGGRPGKPGTNLAGISLPPSRLGLNGNFANSGLKGTFTKSVTSFVIADYFK